MKSERTVTPRGMQSDTSHFAITGNADRAQQRSDGAARAYPWRSLRPRITSIRASVTTLELISGQSISATP